MKVNLKLGEYRLTQDEDKEDPLFRLSSRDLLVGHTAHPSADLLSEGR